MTHWQSVYVFVCCLHRNVTDQRDVLLRSSRHSLTADRIPVSLFSHTEALFQNTGSCLAGAGLKPTK